MTKTKTILPIIAYGDPVLKEKCKAIDKDYPNLAQLIDEMFETMREAPGVGLAAPQIGLPIRLFVVDASSFAEDEEDPELLALKDFKKVFINASIIEESGDEWSFEEGCLSIPKIKEDVIRQDTVRLNYYDANFKNHEEEFTGIPGRIIQHEYDHTEGILFADRLNSLKKRLLKKKLADISSGSIEVGYEMKFPLIKK